MTWRSFYTTTTCTETHNTKQGRPLRPMILSLVTRFIAYRLTCASATINLSWTACVTKGQISGAKAQRQTSIPFFLFIYFAACSLLNVQLYVAITWEFNMRWNVRMRSLLIGFGEIKIEQVKIGGKQKLKVMWCDPRNPRAKMRHILSIIGRPSSFFF